MTRDNATPRPWRYSKWIVNGRAQAEIANAVWVVARVDAPVALAEAAHADAALIVAAVNTYDAHRALVEAAKRSLRPCESTAGIHCRMTDAYPPCAACALSSALRAVEEAGK